jgi:hypothetical protein
VVRPGALLTCVDLADELGRGLNHGDDNVHLENGAFDSGRSGGDCLDSHAGGDYYDGRSPRDHDFGSGASRECLRHGKWNDASLAPTLQKMWQCRMQSPEVETMHA